MTRFNRAALLCAGAALALMYLSTITRPATAKPQATIVMQGCIPAAQYEKKLDRHHRKPEYIRDEVAAAFMEIYNASPPVTRWNADVIRADTYYHKARLEVGIVGFSGNCATFHASLSAPLFLRVLIRAKRKARGDAI